MLLVCDFDAVNTAYEPMVELAVQGPTGQNRVIEAVIDTGRSVVFDVEDQSTLAIEPDRVQPCPIAL